MDTEIKDTVVTENAEAVDVAEDKKNSKKAKKGKNAKEIFNLIDKAAKDSIKSTKK